MLPACGFGHVISLKYQSSPRPMGNGVETGNISDYHMMELHIQPYLLYRRREELFSSCLSTHY